MTLTNNALRSITRTAASSIRPSLPRQMAIHGTPMVSRKQHQQQQQALRNFSTPIAIESSSDNHDIATLLLMLSPTPSGESTRLLARESSTDPRTESKDNSSLSHRHEDVAQEKEEIKRKKKELSECLS